MGRPMLWLACRHHILKVVLKDVFVRCLGPSSSDILLFKRFQKKCAIIDQGSFLSISDENNPPTSDYWANQASSMKEYLQQTLSHGTHPREDYHELLVLSYRFLGGQVQGGFRQPGAYQNARWMAKAIYALKMFMFRHQLDLTAREEGGLRRLRLFISLAYVKQWNEAMVSNRAPLNDLEFLHLPEAYPDKEVSHTTSTALKRHLWYFSEDLVGLGFFDDRIPKDTKLKIV
ncbi:hypothetical protein GWK47_019195 [Chionoecetes opilio]|uniref:Uncharacterized protein n=1 Tax=Chionoecetes opilio TaxID=41210 RepID=A0A8J5CG11_CHIOP|nr:hypothetical protein GWK47_019195 [Chionoecetes opilio]